MRPPADIEVHSATCDQLDEVARVWHESASGMDAAASLMPPLADLRARIDRELEADWELFVAARGGRVLGMLAIRRGEAVLDQIFVLSGAQGSGVGTRLIETAKRAMPDGFTLRMAAGNRRAARFYARAGLRVIGDGAHPVTGIPVQYLRWDGR